MALSQAFSPYSFPRSVLCLFFLSPPSHTAVFFAILLHCASYCPHLKKGSQLHSCSYTGAAEEKSF